jgi:hypothetical protein
MEVTIPAVLVRLAQSGVSVRRRDDKAVFRAAAAPSSDIIALIEARKADISAFLHPDAVRRRLEAGAEAEVLRAARPPDVSDAHWEVALRGLRAFLAAGLGAEAEHLGWPKDELYAVPPLWSRVDLCGAALLIGDREVVEITPTRIGIKTTSGSLQGFYRRAELDYGLVCRERLKLLGDDIAKEESQLRAIEYTIRFFRDNHPNASLEEAKAAVLAAIARTSTK